MLTLTDAAADIIHYITTEQDASEGLRITTQAEPGSAGGGAGDGQGGSEDDTAFAITPAPGPAPEDTVVEAHDGEARVYLEPQAALLLDDQVLDAQVTEEGDVTFRLSQQTPAVG